LGSALFTGRQKFITPCLVLYAYVKVITTDQLQKPNVDAKLVTKFALTTPAVDRAAGSRAPGLVRRGRPAGGGSSTAELTVLEPLGLAVTKTDELVVSSAGSDCSVLLYDVEGRFLRRIDQRRLLQNNRIEQDDYASTKSGARTAASDDAVIDKPDSKYVHVSSLEER